jgi:hypothetical protein
MPVAAPSTPPTSSAPVAQNTNGPTPPPTTPATTAPTTPLANVPVQETASPTITIAPPDSPTDDTVSPSASPASVVVQDQLPETPPILVLTDELGIHVAVPSGSPPSPRVDPLDPTVTSPVEPAAPPSVQQPTGEPGEAVGNDLVPVPEPIDCDEYEYNIAGGYGRMCHSSDPCCGSGRSDTSYCHNLYDNIFPDSAIYSACHHCCPGGSLTVGPPNPTHAGIPKSIQCSDFNAQRYCKAGGCCETTRPTQGYCVSEYLLYGDDVFSQICVSQPIFEVTIKRSVRSVVCVPSLILAPSLAFVTVVLLSRARRTWSASEPTWPTRRGW